jgi:hypothetical protein
LKKTREDSVEKSRLVKRQVEVFGRRISMTDEPREEIQDEEKDVEGHGGIPGPLPEKHQNDEGDDVEAHSPPIPAPPLPQPPLP